MATAKQYRHYCIQCEKVVDNFSTHLDTYPDHVAVEAMLNANAELPDDSMGIGLDYSEEGIDKLLHVEFIFMNKDQMFWRGTTASYKAIAAFDYDGRDHVQTLASFGVIVTAGTGTVRLYDSTNNKTIASLSVNTTSRQRYSTTTISNIPSDGAVLEVQVKATVEMQVNSARLLF